MQKSLIVSKQESNQKVFNFLQRKYEISMSDTHKWIRSGQVRINGKRCQSFDRVVENDEIRVPPFAVNYLKNQTLSASASTFIFDKIFENDDLLVINKPVGIAVQSGSKMETSIVDELKNAYLNASFTPTPAHRLDKNTSGLLLIAKSYDCLQELHTAFQDKESSTLKKYYLAKVQGLPQVGHWEDNLLIKKDKDGREKTFVVKKSSETQLALAHSKIISQSKDKTLLEIQLITGRKHQLRVQCAHRASPIIGDVKYGGKKADRLYLHAYRIEWKNQAFEAKIDW